MEAVVGLLLLAGIGKLLFGNSDDEKPADYEERKNQTFFEYPEGGYGLDDDPVLDEMMFLDIMEGDCD